MAATMWAEILENYVRGEQNEGINGLVQGITSGKGTVENFVESMGTYLTSTETRIRARGVQLMSEVMLNLPRDFLEEQQIKVLLEFFCARLVDHHSITPHTLKSLLAMTSQAKFPPDSAVPLLTVIFREVQVQTMVQLDRRSVYNLLTNLLRTCLKEVQEMGSEFVLGFLHAVDGEKDPRNLILMFNLLPTVVNHFKIDMFVEEAYEVVACYFPVDFNPPPNDPYGISRQNLADSLRTCLSCTPKFAQFCLPMIMEKLSSDLQSARLDSYQLLQACAPVYSRADLMSYMEAVWSYCRKELMQGISVVLDKEALKTLVAMVTAVSSGLQSSSLGGGGDGDIGSFLRNILTECRQHLCEPDHRMIHPCSKLLVAIATASYPACTAVLRYAVPILLDQMDIFQQTRERMILLDFIQRLIGSGHPHLDKSEEWAPVFAHHTDSIVTTLLSCLTSDCVPDLRRSGLGALAEVVQVPLLMDQDRLSTVGQELIRVLSEEQSRDVRSDCIHTISCLAKSHSEYVKSNVMTALWMKVQQGVKGYHEILPDMAMVAMETSDELSKSLTTELMKKIENADFTGDQLVVYLSTLHAITHKLASESSNLDFLLSVVIYPLLKMVVSASLLPSLEAGKSPLCCGDILVAIGEVIRAVVPKLDNTTGSDLCRCAVDVFLHGDLNRLELKLLNKSVRFHPLDPVSPVHQSQLVSVLQPVVCSLRRDISIPSSKQLMTSLLYIAAHSPVWLASTWAAKTLAGVVNKHPLGSDLDAVLVEAEELLSNALSSQQEGLVRQQALFAWMLLTKSLVMRSHPKAGKFLTILLQMLTDPEFGHEIPHTLGTLLSDMKDVLNEDLHAEVRLMYKQRIFLQALPAVMALLDVPGHQTRSITALCYLLPSVPRPVLLAELPPLVPRLVASLTQADPLPLLPILDIMEPLISDALPSLVEQADALVPTLLRLSGYEKSMKVRIASLKCLGALTALPYHHVFPHQKTVVRGLTARLDDKKRLVRKEAVNARTKWILLQQDTKR